MKVIECNSLVRQYLKYQYEYEGAVLQALRSGNYILGSELELFENKYAAFCGAKYCVGVNSGLDALVFAIRALGIGNGDEVIVPANTYIASVLAITENDAIPVFVDPDEYYNIDVERIESIITQKTKAILPVHLYGQACQMDKLMAIAKKYNLFVIEDCAQSHGSSYNGKMTGTFGDVGCYSFYPTKNLGAFGDGGAIITDNLDIADKIRMFRNYGSKIKYQNEIEGRNSRLDEIQAALLSVKLSHLKELTEERKMIAEKYLSGIKNPSVKLPMVAAGAEHVYHQFVVRVKNRQHFQRYLEEKGIHTLIHYPIPVHLAECYKKYGFKIGDFQKSEQYANEVVSLPMFNGITDEEINWVIEVVNSYI